MTLMNQSQFASHLGRHRSYVTELKQKGLIVMRAGKVDVEASEKLMAELADPAKKAVVDRHAENRGEKPQPPAADKHDEVTGKAGSVYQNARAMKEKYNAMAAKISYEKELGILLVADEARAAVADGDAIIRNRLESLPDVLAPQLAAETDEQKIRMLLFDQVEQLLSDLSRSFYQLAK